MQALTDRHIYVVAPQIMLDTGYVQSTLPCIVSYHPRFCISRLEQWLCITSLMKSLGEHANSGA